MAKSLLDIQQEIAQIINECRSAADQIKILQAQQQQLINYILSILGGDNNNVVSGNIKE